MPNVFRWNITRREQLGRLVTGEPIEGFGAILDEVRRCSARVIGMAGDARLVFIGRSLENLYDYLTGAFADTSWARRLTLLPLSLKSTAERWTEMPNVTRSIVREHFGGFGLDPASIASSDLPIALVDVIYEGDTFASLLGLLSDWASDDRIDVRAVRRRLRVVGIITRGCGGYTNNRWKRLDWARTLRPKALKGVSVPSWFWSHLGDSDRKVSRSAPMSSWGDPEMARPPRDSKHVEGLRLAVALHYAGSSRPERDALAATIAELPAMRHAWCRVLAAELRAAVRPNRVERNFISKTRVRSWRTPRGCTARR